MITDSFDNLSPAIINPAPKVVGIFSPSFKTYNAVSATDVCEFREITLHSGSAPNLCPSP